MSRLGSPSARGTAAASPPRDRPIPLVVVGVLITLSVWAVLYELACTAAPGLLHALPWTGIGPDVAFGLGGLLLIVRSVSAERGWALIGVGAWCWAAGGVYWQLKLAHMSSPPVPSWAGAGYLSFCPLTFVGILSLIRTRLSGAPKTLIADALAATL